MPNSPEGNLYKVRVEIEEKRLQRGPNTKEGKKPRIKTQGG